MATYKHIDIRGADLAYLELGDGPQHILLVHANLSDIRSYGAILPLLSERHHVVAYSRRYAWPNEPLPAGADDPWDEQAEDMAELIRKLNVAPCHIVANSSGATMALLVAQEYPELVKTLFLEEPPVVTLFLPKLPPSITDVLRLLWNHPSAFIPTMRFGIFTIAAAESHFRAGKDEEGLHTFLRGVLNTKAYEELTEARKEQARVNMQPHKAILLGSLPLITVKDVKKVATRTFMLTGENTSGAQRCINSLLADVMPNAEEVLFKWISHLLHEDDPASVAKAILERTME